MRTVTITYTKFTGFADSDSLPSHVQVSDEFQLLTACSPASLLHPTNMRLQFDFDLAEGWLSSDAVHTNAQVPAHVTRECIVKYRARCVDEINHRSRDYNSGVWTREEIKEAVQELNAEVADAERLHCGSAEIEPLVVA